MGTPTDPVVIISDDPTFGSTLQHRLEDEGRAATVQRPDECRPKALMEQRPGLLVVHAADVEHPSLPADALAAQVRQAPDIDDVPVIACADHRTLRQDMVNQLRQHRGAVVASSAQPEEVHAKLHDLDASRTRE